MDAHALPLAWPMYLAQSALVMLFTMGFITYQNRDWQKALHENRNRWQRLWWRFWVPASAVALAALLFTVGNGRNMPQTGLTFNALTVFMLTFIMFDQDTTKLEYALRGMALLGIGGGYYYGHFATLGFISVVAFFCLWAALIWWLRPHIRYHVARHILAIESLSVMFWLTIPDAAVGIHFTPLVRVQALGYSTIAICMSGAYLYRIHQDALQNAAARHNATYDALTNAMTYAKYAADIHEAFSQSQASGTPMTIATTDIDHFKAINDQYGHLAGNTILTGIAKTLQHQLNASDVKAALYRTGGEEFTIVCRDADTKAALPLARACWQAVRETTFASGDYQIACTLSCGLATIKKSDRNVDDLFDRADTNLYLSKQRGRDTITMYGQPVTTMRPERAIATTSYYTQRIIDLNQDLAVVANEVKLADWDRTNEIWTERKWSSPLSDKLNFMTTVTKMNPDERLAVYLSLEEFQDPATPARLKAFMAQQPAPTMLWLTLPEVPTIATLNACMPRYPHDKMRVLTQVSALKDDAEQVSAILPLVDGLKLTLAGLRAAFPDDSEASKAMAAWYQRCRDNATDVIFAEIENSVDADYVTTVLHGHYAQGEVFDRPELPRLA